LSSGDQATDATCTGLQREDRRSQERRDAQAPEDAPNKDGPGPVKGEVRVVARRFVPPEPVLHQKAL